MWSCIFKKKGKTGTCLSNLFLKFIHRRGWFLFPIEMTLHSWHVIFDGSLITLSFIMLKNGQNYFKKTSLFQLSNIWGWRVVWFFVSVFLTPTDFIASEVTFTFIIYGERNLFQIRKSHLRYVFKLFFIF